MKHVLLSFLFTIAASAQTPVIEFVRADDSSFTYREAQVEKTEDRKPRDPNRLAVLYIGNSLVYYNSVAQITEALGANEKRPLYVRDVTLGGASLEQLWNETDALRVLWREHWDYVVVQGGGGRLSPLMNPKEFNFYLSRFEEQIRKSGAEPLYYMVWRQNETTEHNKASAQVAKRLKMRIVPVGIAWHELVSTKRIERMDLDGTHQDALGAYLIACTTFSTIYGKAAPDEPTDFKKFAQIGAEYDMALRKQKIAPEQAKMIREAAWQAVDATR